MFLGTKSPGNESSSERKVQRTKVPRNFRSPGTKVPENERARERKFFRSTELSFPENKSSRERKVLGTKVPGTFVPPERKFPIGTIRSWERKVLGTKSPGAEIMHLLIAYFLSNICAKNYPNRFLYVRVMARQITDILLGHSVYPQIQ